MIKENNKKILARRPLTTRFLVFILITSFLFGQNGLAANDYSKATLATPVSTNWNNSVSTYDKPTNGTLSAPEWNGLFYDFVNTWATSTMAGPLGIGTSNPTLAKFQIEAGNGIIGQYINGGTTVGTDLLKLRANAATQRLILEGAGGTVQTFLEAGGSIGLFGTVTNHDFRIRTNYVDRMTFDTNGNIGISTTAPSYKLDVVGAAQFSQPVIVGTPTIGSHAATRSYVDSAAMTAANTFWTANGSSIYNSNSGNVGIGTNNPTDNFQVLGTATFGNIASTSQAVTLKASQYPAFKMTNADNSYLMGLRPGGSFAFTNVSNNGVVMLFNSDAVDGRIQVVGSNVGLIPNGAGNVGIGWSNNYTIPSRLTVRGTTDNSSSAALNVMSTSTFPILFARNDGNVGIGTTNPGAKLHVSAAASNKTFLFYSENTLPFTPVVLQNISSSNTSNGTETSVGLNLENSSQSNNTYSPFITFSRQSSGTTYNSAYASIGGVATGNTDINWVQGGLVFGTANNYGPVERMRINSLGNVGISTTTPVYKLDVAGAAQFSQQVIVGTPTAASHAATKSYVDSAAMSAANSFWTANGSNIYNSNGGNVGIGTTTPGTKLHISATNTAFNSTGALAIYSTSGDGADLGGQISLGGNNSLYGNLNYANIAGRKESSAAVAADGYLQFSTLSSAGGNMLERMRITSTGNVGIGTTNPQGQLHVTSNITGTAASLIVEHTQTGTGLQTAYIDAKAENKLYFRGFQGSTQKFQFGYNSDNGDIVGIGYGTGNNIIINSSGNVGINTTTASYKLDVAGTAQFSQPVIVGTPTIASHAATKSYVDSAAMSAANTFWTANGANIYNSNSGGVGIGTTNPLSKLDVRGSLYVFDGASSTSPNLMLLNNSYQAGFKSIGGSMVFMYDGTNEGMRLSGGRLGIGNTAPLYLLSVKGNSGQDTALHLWQNGIGAATIGLKASDGKLYISNTLGGVGDFGSASKSITLDTSGNVGIGTTTPTEKLHIVVPGVAHPTIESTSATDYLTLLIKNSVQAWQIGFHGDNGTFRIRNGTSGAYPFVIATSSNVGISSTNPAYKLDVAGAAQFSQPVIVGTPTIGSHAATRSYVDSTAMSAANSFWTANGTSIYNSNSGNVGIGTTTPVAKLEVLGQSFFGITNKLKIQESSDALSIQGTASTSDGVKKNIALNAWGGNVGIGTISPGAKLHVAGSTDIGLVSTNAVLRVGWDTNNNVEFGFSSGSPYMQGNDNNLGNGGPLSLNPNGGNVGIGTTTPIYKLEVNGSASLNSVIFNNNGIYKRTYADSPMSFQSNYSGPELFDFRYGNTALLTIRQNGNVGIATSTPDYKLDVVGTAQFSQPVIVGTPTIASHATTKSYVDSAAMSAANTFWTANGNNIYNSNSGNVGVGISNPNYKLDVNGNIANTLSAVGENTFLRSNLARTNTTGDSAVWSFFTNTAATPDFFGKIGFKFEGGTADANKQFQISVANQSPPVLVASGAGNVGIGTINPSAKLNISVANSNIALRLSSTGISAVGQTVGDISFFDTANNNEDARIAAVVENSYGSGLAFSTKLGNAAPGLASEKMRILANGNVGIGTSDPIERLQVGDYSSLANNGIRVNGSASGDAYLKLREGSGDYGFTIRNMGSASNNLDFIGHNASATGNVWMSIMRDSGNVGISTTTPSYKLDVAGTAQFTQPVIVGTPTATNHATTKSYVDSVAGGGIGSGTLGQTLRHNGVSWTADSNLYNNGTNIGIGTTNPITKLNIISTNFLDDGHSISFNSVGSLSYFYGIGAAGFTGGEGIGIWGGTELETKTATNTHIFVKRGGNVGIGTTNPTQKLMISGNTLIDAGNMLYFRDTTTYINEGSGLNIVAGNTRSLNLAGGTGTDMTITSAGNVGIGTTNPASKLDVTGDIRVSGGGAFALYNAVGATPIGGISRQNDVQSASIQIGAFGGIGFTTGLGGSTATPNSTTSELWIDSSGNVGIGTTTPAYKLDVAGTAQFSQPVIVGTPTIASHATTKSYVDSAAMSAANSFWTASGTNIYNSNSGNVGVGTINPTAKTEIVGPASDPSLTHDSNSILNLNRGEAGSTELAFTIVGSSPYTASIQHRHSVSDGIAYPIALNPLGGNVGIGTTSPTVKLDVNGVIRGWGGGATDLASTVVGASLSTEYRNNPGVGLFLGTIQAGGGYISQYIQAVTANGATAKAISLNPYGGNVGIGTTTPGNNLEVSGLGAGIRLTDSTVAGGTYWDFQAGAGSGGFSLQRAGVQLMRIRANGNINFGTSATPFARFTVEKSGTTDYFGINNASDGDVMVIKNSGNVGISTATPEYKLDVAGTAQFSQPVIVGTPTIASHATTKSYVDSAAMSAANSFWTASGTNIYNSNSGSVGIGSTNPSNKLTVFKALGSDDPNVFQHQFQFEIKNGLGTTNSKSIGIGLLDNGKGVVQVKEWNVGYNDLLLNPVAGNVGIGTTNPGAKLSVNGSAVIGANSGRSALGLSVVSSYDNSALTFPGDAHRTLHLENTNNTVNSFTSLTMRTGNDGNGTWYDIIHKKTGPSAGTAIHSVQSNQVMALTSGGSVGIGTTTPTAKLQVEGSALVLEALRLTNNMNHSSDRGVKQTFYVPSGTGSSRLGGEILVADTNNVLSGGSYMALSTENISNVTTEKLRIDASGNVGISTTTPSYKLDVAGTAQFSQPVLVGTPTAAGHATTKSYVDSAAMSAANSFWTASGNNIYNSNSGNIGVGTTNPGATLDVNGNILTNGQIYIKATTNQPRLQLLNSVGNGGFFIEALGGASEQTNFKQLYGSGSFAFYNNNFSSPGSPTPLLYVGSNVGVGTTTPLYNLEVKGTFKASSNSSSIILNSAGDVLIGI